MKKDQGAMEEKRKDIRDGVEYCLHNIPKETCSWCSKSDKKGKKAHANRK